ncbi:MAG: CDP-glycerol glycerophosphotransferase family protein [Firmicutes bacterium]|nr:CDP-glycerol glycerophosphotransferase family protein [Bacillota bacterium]
MGLSKKILNIALAIIDVLTFFIHPKKGRILFNSLTQKELSSDFKSIYEALEKEGKYDLRTNLLVFEKNLKGDFLYFLNCLKQLVIMKSCELVILNDNNYIVSMKKPKGVKVLQTWHACGAVKKFGNQIKRQYPVRNYDALLCNAEYWKDSFSEAFGIDSKNIYTTGLPRIDELLTVDKKENFYQKFPECRGKKLVLYAPTFRGNIIDGLKVNSFDLERVSKALGEDYKILYKFHPLLKNVVVEGNNLVNTNGEDLYMLMQVSDCMISDYSSIFFDYSLLDKKMIGYTPDYEEYNQTIGYNMDYKKDFAGPVCIDEEELIQAILEEDTYSSQRKLFQEKFMEHKDGKNTERVVQLINNLMR